MNKTVNIMLVDSAIDGGHGRRVVTVPVDHPLADFAQRWRKHGKKDGYIDLGNDTEKLIEMWLEAEDIPTIQLPAQIDYVLFGICY